MIVRAVRAVWPEKQGKVVVELSLEEAEDLAQAMADTWPPPDLAYKDAMEIMEAAASLRES